MSHSTTGKKTLRIAVLGTRGVPANYGGFETFAEELSTRLAQRGHRITVFGRAHYVDPFLRIFRGVEIEVFPCIRSKYLETVSHTTLSVLVSLFSRFDVALVCNAANAFLCWLPRLAGQKVVLNVDGIERHRKKWNLLGKSFYYLSERLATLFPHEVVTDARVIQRYYRESYGCPSRFIPYGASTERVQTREALHRFGLAAGGYLLYVSRLEPENNAHRVLEAYRRSGVELPLVLVGDAPYGRRYIRQLRRSAAALNVLIPGAIYGPAYRELLSHCLCYVHATEVGGTHPALVEAMGAGCLVLVNDTPENREVAEDGAVFYPFNDVEALSELFRQVVGAPERFEELRNRARQRVVAFYNWERVVDRYEELFHEIVSPSGGPRRRLDFPELSA